MKTMAANSVAVISVLVVAFICTGEAFTPAAATTPIMPATMVAEADAGRLGGVTLPAVPVAVTERAKRLARTGDPESAPPPADDYFRDTRIELEVKPGVTELVPIARNYLNRIVTPFADPKVVTVNPIKFRKEGASIFITATGDKPVGIYVLSNEADDERSISLALVPKSIPPRTIKLSWSGAASGAPVMSKKARQWEESSPYVEKLIDLLTLTAKGSIPPGYALSDPKFALSCADTGFAYASGQRLVGTNLSIYVLRATNISSTTRTIDESLCYQWGVAAVSAWPRVALEPGQATEIYVVLRNDVLEEERFEQRRPSLLGGVQ